MFTLLEGTTGKPSQIAPGREAKKWMEVASDDNSGNVDQESLKSRLRFSPEFATALADTIVPGTTVVITDGPVVRKAIPDSTVFAN